MKLLDLGVLHGDFIAFGGVYSNLHSLEALIEQADILGVAKSNLICTGDIVAYCAYAEASLQKMIELSYPVIAGNCEKQLAENADDCGCGFDEGSTCSLLSRSWYAHARAQVSDVSRDWMSQLPDRIVFEHEGLRYVVVHGAASDISKFIWEVTNETVLRDEIKLLEDELGKFDRVISGHSGKSMIRNIDGVKWINAGAIGLPENNGDLDTKYLHISKKSLEINSLYYDVESAYQAMQACSLTQGYHTALKTGYWPSEEVLPLEMRVQSAKG